jgi:hypothetical protein
VIPSRNDPVTILCPVCGTPFTPTGKRRYCRDACRVAAHRRRHRPTDTAATIPPPTPRRPVTVYECDSCGIRLLGEQRCADCGTFMSRLGIGGTCPCREEPITMEELLER